MSDIHRVSAMAYYQAGIVPVMRRVVVAAALLLLAGPASASLVESLPSTVREAVASDPVLGPMLAGSPAGPVLDDAHLHYQADAGTEFDAPDSCAEALASPLPFDLPLGGAVDGLLVPVDDEIDHYRVAIGEELVGGRVTLSVLGREATLPFAIDAFQPGCGASVTAEESQPLPPPSVPEPEEGERQVAPHNLGEAPDECSDRWFFVFNQFGQLTPPEAIHVVWTDGSEAHVPLLKDTPATLAQYEAADNGFTLHSVTANVPAEWSGQFTIGEAPCNVVDGGAVFGEPSVATDTSIEFTPTEAGTYVLVVRAVPPALPGVPTSVPLSCHSFCVIAPDTLGDASGYNAVAL